MNVGVLVFAIYLDFDFTLFFFVLANLPVLDVLFWRYYLLMFILCDSVLV